MKIGYSSLFVPMKLFPVTAFCLLNLFTINPAMAQEKVWRTVTVTGQGVERIQTTLTDVQLGVEIEGKTATEVQQEVAKRTAAVVELLRSRSVQQLQTTGINLRQNYQYINNQNRLVGFIGSNTVSFRLKTEAVGALLDEAVRVGATRIDNISFTATEEAIAQAQQQALSKAALDAQVQGNAVLKALNLSAKEVVSIQVNGAEPPVPLLKQDSFTRAAASPMSTPVIGGEQTIRASVTLQISY